MKSRQTFTTIAIIVGLALGAAITMSAIWLVRSYRDRQEDFASRIDHILKEALEAEGDARAHPEELKVYIIGTESDSTITYPENLADIDVADIGSITVLKTGDKYAGQIKYFLDSVDRCDSLTGFHTVDFLTILYARAAYSDISQDFSVSVTSEGRTVYTDHKTVRNPLTFSVTALTIPECTCTLTITNPHRTFLRQMSGIIISTTSIALILCLAFIYLIRTVFRQKTLEDMRRDLTHNVTHELKTPIATALAATDAIINYPAGENPQKRRRYMGIIHDQLLALGSMVERILDLSVQESGHVTLNPEQCSLVEMLSRLCSETRIKAPEAQITESYPAQEACILADRFHLSNAIANILDNALKYSGSGSGSGGTSRIQVSLEVVSGSVLISIKDNGIGIPPAQRRHIFEKYYRVPTGDVQNVRGFGIGLYYSRLVVEKLGGSISVDAATGGGSVFTITLPYTLSHE